MWPYNRSAVRPHRHRRTAVQHPLHKGGGGGGGWLYLWIALLSQTRLVTPCFQGGWVRGGWNLKALSLIVALTVGDILISKRALLVESFASNDRTKFKGQSHHSVPARFISRVLPYLPSLGCTIKHILINLFSLTSAMHPQRV